MEIQQEEVSKILIYFLLKFNPEGIKGESNFKV